MKVLKKTLSICLAATLCLSLACPAFTASSVEISGEAPVTGHSDLTMEIIQAECKHTVASWADNGDGTHGKICDKCGETIIASVAHSDSDHDWLCDDCGVVIVCEHLDVSYSDNGDGTHNKSCNDCGETVITGEAHVDADGDLVCDHCGGAVECTHPNIAYTDNGDGTHSGLCAKCDKPVNVDEKHIDADADCSCDLCGGKVHGSIRYIDNEDGETHDGVCNKCETVLVKGENHIDADDDGMCDKCAYEMTAATYILRASIPTVLPIVADTDGNVSVATDAAVINLVEDRAIEVKSLSVKLTSNWSLVNGDTTFSEADKDSKLLALSFRGTPVEANGSMALQSDNWTIEANASLPLNMQASVPTQSKAASSAGIGRVTFTLDWADGVPSVEPEPELDPNPGPAVAARLDAAKMQSALKSLTGDITIVDGVYIGSKGIDVSKAQDGSVMVVIDGQDAKVYGHKVALGMSDASGLFSGFAARSMDLRALDVSEVDTMATMFNRCSNLVSLDISGWNVRRAIMMYGTFANCVKLTDLNMSGWDTSVASLESTFMNCNSLTNLDISSLEISSSTMLLRTFMNCSKLAEILVMDEAAETILSGSSISNLPSGVTITVA